MASSCARLASAPDRQGPTGLHRLQGRIYEPHKARCIFEQPGHRNSPASQSGAKFGFICRACPRGLREQARRLNAAEMVARRRETRRLANRNRGHVARTA
jgi:hypothetical protein